MSHNVHTLAHIRPKYTRLLGESLLENKADSAFHPSGVGK